MPEHIVQATISDTQALIWSKHVEFDPDELGTECQFKRWMKSQSQYGSRSLDLGLSVMDWESHLKACLLYTSPSPRDLSTSRMPSSA